MNRLAAGILAALSLSAASIRGRVLDPSKAPVQGAVVRLSALDGSSQRTAVTAADGVYEFRETAPGTFLVSVPGAETARIESGAAHDLLLRLDRVESRVVITASATAQDIGETAKAFDVVDGAEMSRRAEFAVSEALRLVPGVRIAQLGGPGSLARIQTRGLRTFDTSVLIDGFRFRDAAAPQGDSMGFFADLLTVNTDRVEVLRGSGSSLYGTHAIGGVVNVVTDSGGGPLRADITNEGGGLGLYRGALKLAGGAWRDRLHYSGGLAHLNVTRGVDGNDPARNSSAHGFLRAQAGPRTSLSGRFFANDSFTGLNSSPFAAPLSALGTGLPVAATANVTFTPNPDDPDNHRAARFYSGLAAVNHQLAAGASVRAQYQGLYTTRDSRNGPVGGGFQPRFRSLDEFDSRIDTAALRSDVTRWRRHVLTSGYEFERERFDNHSANADPNPATRVFARTGVAQSSHAVFAQDQIRLVGDRLQATLGARWQSFRLSAPSFAGGAPRYQGAVFTAPPDAFTGDAALAWLAPSKGTKLRAHVGNSYRAPALFERFGTGFFAGTFTPFGDPRIAPERAVAIDSGFDQYLADSRVKVSGTWFYTRLRQVIGFDFSGLVNRNTDPFGRSSGYRNTGGGLARGMEWSVEATPVRRLRMKSAYTYTKAQERTSVLLGGSTRSIRISDHMFTAFATYRVVRGLDVTMDLFAASNYWFQFFAGGNRPFQFAGPKKADLVVSYTRALSDRWNAEFYTRIENFTGRTYFEDGFRTPGAWAVGGLKITR